ncbi:MAG: lytic murein transglycosylase [Thermodesulfobacteria bacterium]|nr:lytic murein transglycosylase [Thermodesulfobacteriota bacterium]
MRRRLLLFSLFWLLGSFCWASEFAPLISYLKEKGFSESYLKELFSRPEVRFLPQIMPRKLLHDEYKLNYAQFLAPQRISRAQKFLEEHRELLQALERHFGVPKEILVAIFLVETDLGHYTGKYRTFNVLASLALSEDWERVKKHLPAGLSPEEEARLKNFMLRRARWAKRELVALLRYAQQNELDPLAIKGSIFGAFGLPQFVPSSVLQYGYDWDGDGKVNLFELEDALASMANYLARHGWAKASSREAQLRVIKTYNKSQPYAETVLKIAERLSHAAS